MSISVKAYLQTADDSQEIRRFAVDQGASTSYEYLSTKITQVFPSIGRSDSFTLSYRDREGDLIAFSNDNELSHALGQLSEEILRVYVTLTCEKSHCDDSKYCEQLFNPEVICGGCEVRDCEPRFKCVVCPDYYLCKGCEEKGLHPEHEMIQNRELQIGRSHKGVCCILL
uniref:Sequestosome-1-like n=1 Tax=Saccoglossus kowalevskii TaxID=10224 RepID=A0ABM0MK57_SACKO|nr:PREDICTED: sequestosome-1-like [Saccoglossus kowalevskii]